MSAPYPGRQSPEPETQTGNQQRDPPSHGKLDGGPSAHHAPEFSYEKPNQKSTVLDGSNPKHPLEDIEAAKFKK